MFGNVRGWAISGLIAVLFAVLIWKAGVPEAISPPTGRLKVALEPSDLPTSPKSLVAEGTEDCDAGDLYRQAIQDFKDNHRTYERFTAYQPKNEVESKKISDELRAAAPNLKAVNLIVQARGCSKMNLYAGRVDQLVNYDNSKPGLDALKDLGNLTNRIAGQIVSRDKDTAKAQKYLEATFLLGRRLYDERVMYEEYFTGTDLMTSAAHIMARLTLKDDKAKADALLAFELDTSNHQKQFTPVWQVLRGIENKTVQAHAGDVFQIARESKDPMWRTEATLTLGRLKYQEGARNADHIGAARVLKKMAEDPALDGPRLKPVKVAATAGRDLTREEFRKYGG